TLTATVRCAADLPSFSAAAAFSPDSRLLVTGGHDGVVRVWDAVTGRPVVQLEAHNGDVGSIAFSSDGRWLVTGGWNLALVWDVAALLRANDPSVRQPTRAELTSAWELLGDANPAKASPALVRFTRGGDAAVAFLHERLAEPPAIMADRIDRWVADLES